MILASHCSMKHGHLFNSAASFFFTRGSLDGEVYNVPADYLRPHVRWWAAYSIIRIGTCLQDAGPLRIALVTPCLRHQLVRSMPSPVVWAIVSCLKGLLCTSFRTSWVASYCSSATVGEWALPRSILLYRQHHPPVNFRFWCPTANFI